jgi:HD-like signal output (HDOD) protein
VSLPFSNAPKARAATAPSVHAGARAVDDAQVRAAAFAFLSSLAEEVSKGTVNLPCFPDVVLRVRQVLSRSEATADQLVKVIGIEPRLASRLMQICNTPTFTQRGRVTTDLKMAVVRLGMHNVQSATMSFAMNQIRAAAQLRPIARELKALWRKSIAVAAISRTLARRVSVNPDEAFFAGLVSGIGRLYILTRAINRPDLTRSSAFMELVAGWHSSIGRAVLENWKFSEDIAGAVGAQEDYERSERRRGADLTDVLVASVLLADALEQPKPRRVDLIPVFSALRMQEADCHLVLSHVEQSLSSLQSALAL